MFQFVGMDFFSGPDALNPAPNNIPNITNVELRNAIYDHFNVTYDTDLFDNTTIPDQWTYDTILNATFNGTTGAGNLEYAIKYVDGIKIKRRLKRGANEKYELDSRYDWIVLDYVKVDTIEDLIFTFNDFLNAWGEEYEYALVPVVNGVEGRYIINNIISKFNGVFIGNAEQAFKFLYDVQYNSNTRNQRTGTFEPLGKKYPIIVANGILNYESGSVSGTILNDDYKKTHNIDKLSITKKTNSIKDFLTDKKPKILKDWSGKIWLVMITDNITVQYKQGSGMTIPNVTFNWTEIGDASNQQDLYDTGMIDVLD